MEQPQDALWLRYKSKHQVLRLLPHVPDQGGKHLFTNMLMSETSTNLASTSTSRCIDEANQNEKEMCAGGGDGGGDRDGGGAINEQSERAFAYGATAKQRGGLSPAAHEANQTEKEIEEVQTAEKETETKERQTMHSLSVRFLMAPPQSTK